MVEGEGVVVRDVLANLLECMGDRAGPAKGVEGIGEVEPF